MIGTVQTTLIIWTIFVTVYPKLLMPLKDLHLKDIPKCKPNYWCSTDRGICCHPPLPHGVSTTKPCFCCCRPWSDQDALLINIDSNAHLHCTFIPRKIPWQELVKLLPDNWKTNYKRNRSAIEPLQSTEPDFIKELLDQLKSSSRLSRCDYIQPSISHYNQHARNHTSWSRSL